MNRITVAVIAAYLAAIVAANLIIDALGPVAVPFVAFALIGFDLTARDYLHGLWWRRNLPLRMAALIAAGALVTWLVSPAAGDIALASVVAFTTAAILDTIVFGALRDVDYDTRVDTSNIVAAITDSLLFVTIAFGFAPVVIFTQIVAKIAGGTVWRLLLEPLRVRALLARNA